MWGEGSQERRRGGALQWYLGPDPHLPRGPFRTKNATTTEKIVNYHAVVFLLRPPDLLRWEPLSEGKNVCNFQENCVRTRCGVIANHYAIVNLLRQVNLLRRSKFTLAGSFGWRSLFSMAGSSRLFKLCICLRFHLCCGLRLSTFVSAFVKEGKSAINLSNLGNLYTEQMDAEGLGRKLLLNPSGDHRRTAEKPTVGTVPASQKKLTLQALSSSLNAGAAKGGCLNRGEAFGCPPVACLPERPRPFTHYRESLPNLAPGHLFMLGRSAVPKIILLGRRVLPKTLQILGKS